MIDLHTHTKYSDGTWSVTELLENAEKNEVSVLSITDHNSVDAHIELKGLNISKYFSGKIIVGSEFDIVYKNAKLELLGYNFDMDIIKSWLSDQYDRKKVKSRFAQEFSDLVENCKKLKLRLDDNINYNPATEYPIDKIYNEIIKYQENKRLFTDKEWGSLNGFFRSCTCSSKFPLYVDFSQIMPSAKEVSNLIRNAGGKVFLAHLFIYELEDHIGYLDSLYDEGIIDGVETYYPAFTDEQIATLEAYCREKGLFMSGGTDCHGEKRKDVQIGKGYGNMNIPESIIDKWI